MEDHEKPSRDKQVELMVGVEERVAGYLRNWIARPDFRAALHRYDQSDGEDGRPLRRYYTSRTPREGVI